MTYFRLPNRYSATIIEGTFESSMGFDYRFKVIIRNACNIEEEVVYSERLSDCMEMLSAY